ncbi:MAG: phytoene/squalene synthase family protein [Bacteroidota bacterium]|nr:phytoene/squalene synthase family protein [Bacteroidota bacterium]
MKLYKKTAYQCSTIVTKRYSTSFNLAIKTLDKSLHDYICGIYGFVRLADEVVDTFHDYDKANLLAKLKEDTYSAIDQGISTNLILHAFADVVRTYNLDRDLIDSFLHSMEMDLYEDKYAQNQFEEYVYGSAEVVGLMCLKVFCGNNVELYNQIKEPARKLGAAFQKVNFLRDVQSDFEERGRVYFPGVDWKTFNNLDKSLIEEQIEDDFIQAKLGIKLLPKSSRSGVLLAYRYYYRLFNKIRKTDAQHIMQTRIRVANAEKLSMLLRIRLKKVIS